MVVLERWECLSWMDWVSWRVWLLDGIVSGLVVGNEMMVRIELWIVQNSNPFRLVSRHSMIIIHLNWTIFLLFNPFIWVDIVSIMRHPCHWLVRLMDLFELTDLPQLQSVYLGQSAFQCVHSIVFESGWMNGLMIQICLNYNPFNLIGMLFKVIIITEENIINPTTTRIYWQCEVRLNELMNEQIFLHWHNSKEICTTSRISD